MGRERRATVQLGDQRASGNVEDRRGIGALGGTLGVGGIVIAVIAYFLGFDPGSAINVAEQVVPQRETREAPKGAPADEMGQFVAKILGSTEEVWGKIFQQSASVPALTLVL
jgi:predicted metalloprotease